MLAKYIKCTRIGQSQGAPSKTLFLKKKLFYLERGYVSRTKHCCLGTCFFYKLPCSRLLNTIDNTRLTPHRCSGVKVQNMNVSIHLIGKTFLKV